MSTQPGTDLTYSRDLPDQLQLFLLTDEAQTDFSNTLLFYDAIPRHHWKRHSGKDGEFREPVAKSFVYRNLRHTVTLYPATVSCRGKNGEKTFRSVFPAVREEMLEDVLRYLAVKGSAVVVKDSKGEVQTAVVFSLYQVQKELRRRGHTMSLDEIKTGLQVLKKATIDVRDPSDERTMSLNVLSFVALDERTGKTMVQFNPLVTKEILRQEFRRFNYALAMELGSLARWLLKRLSRVYVQANVREMYHIALATILEEAPMSSYSRTRDAIRAVEKALEELVAKGVLSQWRCERQYAKNDRRRITDAVFKMWASFSFQKEVKQSNFLVREAREKQ